MRTLHVLLLLVHCPAWIGCSRSHESSPPPSPAHTNAAQATVSATDSGLVAPELPTQLPTDQARILREAHQGLQALAERSALARELLGFYNARRLTGLIDGSTVRAFEDAPQDGRRHFYVVGNPQYRLAAGDAGIYAEFSCYPNPVMTLHDSSASPFTRGLLLAHEIEHARDCLLNNEPPSEQMSDTWLQGELHAYAATRQILDELSNGAWGRTIVPGSWRERQNLLAMRRESLEQSLFGNLAQDRVRFGSVFPWVNQDLGFLSYLCTQVNLDANGYNVSRIARERTIPQQDEARVQIEMIRGYYRYAASEGATLSSQHP